jgi:hypothetical protein
MAKVQIAINQSINKFQHQQNQQPATSRGLYFVLDLFVII